MSVHKISAKLRNQLKLTVDQADQLINLCVNLPTKQFKTLLAAVAESSWDMTSILTGKPMTPEVAQRLTNHLQNHHEHVDAKLGAVVERVTKYQDVLMKLVLKGAKTNLGHNSELVQKFMQQLESLHNTTMEIEKAATKDIRTASR